MSSSRIAELNKTAAVPTPILNINYIQEQKANSKQLPENQFTR